MNKLLILISALLMTQIFVGITRANTDQYLINYNVPIGLSIISFSPLSDPTTSQGIAQTFNIVLNKAADIVWYANGSKVQTNISTTFANYTNSTANVGNLNISAIATDNIDIKSKTWNWTIQSPVDISPPVTNISLYGTLGNNGWYISNVTVALNVTDDLSGVNYTKYNVNNGSWNIYSTSLFVYIEGINTVNYYSVDNVNNVEQIKYQTIKINKTSQINLLQNPGFENSTITSGLPDYWKKNGGNSTTTFSYPEIGGDLSRAVGIKQTFSGTTQSWIQKVNSLITASTNYTISGFENTNLSSGTSIIGVDWYTSASTYISSSQVKLTGVNKWTNRSVAVKSPSNAANAYFYVQLAGVGKVVYDNVSLIKS